jgi:Beta-propeller repeat
MKEHNPSLGFALFAAIAITALFIFAQVNGLKLQADNRATTVAPASATAAEVYAGGPLTFERNEGQTDRRVKFLAHGKGYGLFFTDSGVVFSVPSQATLMVSRAPKRLATPQSANAGTFNLSFPGANPKPEVMGLKQIAHANYFIGNDRARWRTNIPTFAKVQYRNIYPGVDLIYYGNQRQLEYDLVIAPGADPNRIRLAFKGLHGMRLDPATGDLLIRTKNGVELRHLRPSIYQHIGDQKIAVGGSYRILDQQTVAFAIEGYDRGQSLVIDPTVAFTTFITGNSEDFPDGIGVDGSGNSYITGYTLSSDFPITGGLSTPSKNCDLIQQQGFNCGLYAFVTKLSPTGTILFSTFIGGSGFDQPRAIAVDSSGIFVVGFTTSQDFATNSQYAFGAGNAFVAKLALTGDSLYFCTAFGGGEINAGNAIALDSSHSAYVAGSTNSVDFPTSEFFSQTLHSWQPVFGGKMDGFVVKLDPSGALNYSTYVGGSNDDEALGIAVDSEQHAFVTGDTSSSNFPHLGALSHGAPQNGGFTAFVTRILPDGSGVNFSIFLGGTASPADTGYAVAVNRLGVAYVTGQTASSDFYVTGNAPQKSMPCTSGVCLSAFVAQVFPLGSVLASTYLGGAGLAAGASITTNSLGQVYVAGYTSTNINFPAAPAITPNPNAGFLTKFTPALDSVIFTTFLGDQITGVAAISPRLLISPLAPTTLYTTGIRFSPGSDVRNFDDLDAFVVKLNDSLVSVLRR